jgi:hypothetical protein
MDADRTELAVDTNDPSMASRRDVDVLASEVEALRAEVGRLVQQQASLSTAHAALQQQHAELRQAVGIAPLHELFPDAPRTQEEAGRQMADMRIISDRLSYNWYARRLVVIACLEKSGSTSLEICIREMLRAARGVDHDIGIQKSLQHGPFTHIDALYPEVLLYVRDGGVLRSFLAPSTTNLTLLEHFRCRYLVLVRHPADRLVARYCQLPGLAFEGRYRIDPGYLIENVFDSKMDMEQELDHLITRGYLLDNLIWQANWLRLRDPRVSRLVRYEDMMEHRESTFTRLYRFLFRADMDAELMATLDGFVADFREKYQPVTAADPRRYPKGYSGKVGVRADYFTPGNIKSYNDVIDGFLRWHPHAQLALDTYPDLRIETA